MESTELIQPGGWGYPPRALKKHYLVDGVSLCGKYSIPKDLFLWLTPYDGFLDTLCQRCLERLCRQTHKEVAL